MTLFLRSERSTHASHDMMSPTSEAKSNDDASYEMESYSHSSSNASPHEASNDPRTRSVNNMHPDNGTFQRSSYNSCEQSGRQSRSERIESNEDNVSGANVQRQQSTGPSFKRSSWRARLAKFWTGYVCPPIDQEALRDHLGTAIFHKNVISSSL